MENLCLWLAEHLDIIGEDLRKVAPEEGCGLVLKGSGYRWLQLENTLHSPIAYAIDARQWMLAESQGEQVLAIVHSHVGSSDCMSARDLLNAMIHDPEGRTHALFPGVYYLVFSIMRDGWISAALHGFDVELGAFRKICSWSKPTDS